MEIRSFGATGLRVSAVGFGAGSIGDEATSEAEVDRLLGAALDAGVTLVDTARSYGLSEERLGRLLDGRRDRVILSTKVGYDIPDIPDWTGPCIEAGVDAALRRLRTDWIDVVHLHSCGLDVLQRGEVVDALHRAVASGKVRVAAYSGENEALQWAVDSGAFGSIQCSVSVVDQTVLDGAVAQASAKGLGVLAKRALGNAPWRFETRPEAEDVAEAWQRFRALCGELGASPDPGPTAAPGQTSWTELFTRFTGYAPGVDALLVGTRSAAHLLAAVEAVARGPLEAKQVASLRDAFVRCGTGWRGRI
jgi:aryl-alcohol dehydrogenase-like predicted oxidoreductase